jgi:hypothetical protein
VINLLPDAFSIKIAEAFRDVLKTGDSEVTNTPLSKSKSTAPGRGSVMAKTTRDQGRNAAEQVQRFAQGGNGTIVPASAAAGAPTAGGSNNPNDPTSASNKKILDDLLTQTDKTVSIAEENLAVQKEIRDASTGTAAATGLTGTSSETTEITVNVEGTSTVNVTGFEAGATAIANALSETFGGFTSVEEAKRIANEVLENIRTALLRRGIITPTTQ